MILLTLSSCIEPFMPDTTEYDDVLFIEAQLCNDPAILPYVIISRTVPLSNRDPEQFSTSVQRISGALVSVECDDGNDYLFTETEPGRYLAADPLFIGESGSSYRLTVLHDNKTYQSAFEYLYPSPPIDSLCSLVSREKTTELGDLVYGLRFYANTHDDEPGPSYYRWMLEASYKYNAPLTSSHRWINNELVWFRNDIYTWCYRDIDIPGIYISSTEGLENNVIRNAPLHFKSQYGDELSERYSLYAKQLKISAGTYKFWREVSKLIYETGGLYESQPFSIKGNIQCVSDPDKKILGVFEVAGVSEIREFFERPEEFEIIRPVCKYTDTIGGIDLPWENLAEGSYLYEFDDQQFVSGEIYCFDCRERGGSTEKPPFWENLDIFK